MGNLNAERIRYKMSENQIKTALECLSKPNSSPADREKCYFMWKEPSCFSCYHEVAQNALAIITSQEQRIKELTEENERLRAENETLKVATNEQYSHLCDCHDKIAQMLRQKESDTVREMHFEIKKRCIEGGIYPAFVASVIEQVAKEIIDAASE